MKSHTELGLPVVKLKDTCTEQASYTLSQYLAFGTDKERLFKLVSLFLSQSQYFSQFVIGPKASTVNYCWSNLKGLAYVS